MSLRRHAAAAISRKPVLPSTSHRPKSALSKSSTPSVVALHEDYRPDVVVPASPPRARSKKLASSVEDESNIQVVIRCRRRSEREVQDASPVIVTTNGPRGENVTVETAAQSSVLGVVTLPPTRTYPFDRVFGPEADQAMVYNDVAAPILDQVLMGYNCTLFAYGQTGTGKTYTMQGDLTPSQLGSPSAGAGMIPRVLFKLFQHLEANVPDYSVKISFVELYNEELRDLLGAEMSPPLGNAQPMGMGGGSQPQNFGLKIFDDASKRGVFIQGLEEAAVKNAADAIALLTKGSQRRQIAATKFNDHSSRSHSIFSITVHSKETSALGDDLLRVGKLNLVDLAGSENIGRSGAENKRAREAGMINQSLLTLGRVINALVEKSPHVPYRESKLTRLLQDSLGGRTKTCIIATISPARCNLEETLSTLEYALRAKSIRNKPEINQRLTKNALIKEYVNEIERLKADVLAAREMNGIYFSQDSWDQISAEHELKAAQHEEAKRKILIIESQLNAVREEFEQSIALLHKRGSELQETRDTLKTATDELHAKGDELLIVRNALEEEEVVSEAHQQTEMALDGVASGLRVTVEKSIADIRSLYDKLGRKSSVARANVQAVSECGRLLNAEIISMTTNLEEFSRTRYRLTTALRASAQELQAAQRVSLAAHASAMDERLRKVNAFVKLMQTSESASDTSIEALGTAVGNAGETMRESFDAWSTELKNSFEALCSEAESTSIGSVGAAENAYKAMATILRLILSETREHIEQERKAASELAALACQSANDEIHRLRQQNSLLTRLVQNERAKSESARGELIQRISGIVGEYIESRDQSIREAISDVRQSISVGEKAATEFVAAQGVQLEIGVKRHRDWETSLGKRHAESKVVGDAVSKTLGSVTEVFKGTLTAMQSKVINSVTLHSGEMDRQSKNMNMTCAGAFENLDRIKRARIDATENLSIESQNDYDSLRHSLVSNSAQTEQAAEMWMKQTLSLKESLQSYHTVSVNQISNIEDATRSLLEKGTKEDIATGTTPRKRHWGYPNQWELTKSRDEILRNWRKTRATAAVASAEAVKVEEPDSNVPAFGVPPSVESMERETPMDLDVKLEDKEPVMSSALPSSSSSSLQSHKNTGGNGFGKITRIPGTGHPHALREHSTNLPPFKGLRTLQ